MNIGNEEKYRIGPILLTHFADGNTHSDMCLNTLNTAVMFEPKAMVLLLRGIKLNPKMAITSELIIDVRRRTREILWKK